MNRARIQLVLSLILILLVATVAGLGLERKVRSFQPLGFAAEPAGGGMAVTEVMDPGTGLLPGDRILLANNASFGGADELAQRLRREPETSLSVLREDPLTREDALVTVAYRLPALDVDFPYLVLALSGLVYLLIGLYTLLRQRARQAWLFCLWCIASAALYLLSPDGLTGVLFGAAYALDELARVLLPPLTLHLFLTFPAPAEPGRARKALPFLYLPAAFLLALQADLAFNGGRWLAGVPAAATAGSEAVRERMIAVYSALDRVEMVHLVALSLAAVGVLLYRFVRGRDWEQHRQMQWMVVGLTAGYVPFLVFYAAPAALGLRWPEAVEAFAVLPLALVPLTFAYAILRYKLWDIEVLVRDTLASTLTLFLGVIGFSLVNLAINRGLPGEAGAAHNLLSFVSGLGIAALLVPTRRTLASALERLHYRDKFGKRRALSELGRELLHERDLGCLCSALLEEIETGVELERSNLYLAQGGSLIAVRPEDALPGYLPADAFGEDLWHEGFQRLSGVVLPVGPAPLPAQKVFAAGYRYAFPLMVRDRGIGVALVGFKQDHTPLSSEDILLIRHLLNQAALAIENALLMGQLHRQLQEVQRLQHYSEGIFESSPAGIAVLDRQGRLVSVNAAFACLSGLDRLQLSGRRLEEVLPVPELPALGQPPVQAALPCKDGEAGCVGGERFVEMSLAAYEESAADLGEGLQVLVVHDITERVAMENALREKERLAALGMLAAGVAHEVNTPITGISSYAQMLLSDTPEDDPRYELLKKVERQTFRASRIVNNLLELSRDRQQETRPVALVPLLRETLDLLSDRFEKRRIQLVIEAPEEPVAILGCEGEVQQVFTNLFVNALDALSETVGGRVAVTVEADERSVRVRVRDNGPGIAAEKLEAIFQPFYSTKLSRGGTGLGLAISREIVRRHKGSLQVTSEPGPSGETGACFTVELPRHFSAPEAAGATA